VIHPQVNEGRLRRLARKLAGTRAKNRREGTGFLSLERLSLLALSLLLPTRFATAAAPRPKAGGSGQRLWYRRPATRWEEALPIGNGALGCMVFGRTTQERLQLNVDTLWAGSPYVPDNSEAYAALAEVRRLISEKKFKQAEELASAAGAAVGGRN